MNSTTRTKDDCRPLTAQNDNDLPPDGPAGPSKYGMSKKVELGQYFTRQATWYDDIVKAFTSGYERIIDPFAGDGDLLKVFDTATAGYDIDPTLNWTHNDSLAGIPTAEPRDICVTNPPYLAKNSARKRKLEEPFRYFDAFPEFDDLYQLAIHQCLRAFDRVVAIIPETYISTSHFKDRLVFVNIIEDEMFSDTECPVLVAGWDKDPSPDFLVYKNSRLVGSWNTIEATLPHLANSVTMKFNDPEGTLGVICFDSTSEKSIRFDHGDIVPKEEIKHTSRAKTRIMMNGVSQELIDECNRILGTIRETSKDVIMSPFKGNTKAGERRRRLDFALARRIINAAVNNLRPANDNSISERGTRKTRPFPTLHLGDALTVLKTLPANSVHLCATDPPYFIDGLGDEWDHEKTTKNKAGFTHSLTPGMKFDPKQGARFQEFMAPISAEIYRVLVPGGFYVAFSQARLYHRLAIAVEEAGFEMRDMLAWVYHSGQGKAFSQDHFIDRMPITDVEKARIKAAIGGRKTPMLKPMIEPMTLAQKPRQGTFVDNWMKHRTGLMDVSQRLNGGFPGNVMDVAKPTGAEKGADNDHPTVKPIALIEHVIRLFSTEGQVVLDPFLGSGSHGVAAIAAGRQFIGIERSPHYMNLATNRMGIKLAA